MNFFTLCISLYSLSHPRLVLYVYICYTRVGFTSVNTTPLYVTSRSLYSIVPQFASLRSGTYLVILSLESSWVGYKCFYFWKRRALKTVFCFVYYVFRIWNYRLSINTRHTYILLGIECSLRAILFWVG